MFDERNEASDDTIAYAIVYRFLHLIEDQEPYDEDLDNVLRWGEMNSVGTMTYDGAYIDDWRLATGGRRSLSPSAAYDAMVTFLEGYASRGCRPSFDNLITRLKVDKAGMAALWIKAENLVAEDVEAGEPYRGTYTFGTDPQGPSGSLDAALLAQPVQNRLNGQSHKSVRTFLEITSVLFNCVVFPVLKSV